MTEPFWHELVGPLRQYRGGHHPRRIASYVCRHVDGTTALVRLTADALRAIFFNRTYERMYSLPFSAGIVHPVTVREAPEGPWCGRTRESISHMSRKILPIPRTFAC